MSLRLQEQIDGFQPTLLHELGGDGMTRFNDTYVSTGLHNNMYQTVDAARAGDVCRAFMLCNVAF